MEAVLSNDRCALVLLAEGFDESETIVILSALRDANVYTKSVGLTNGFLKGAHGIGVLPDCTVAELYQTLDIARVGMIILPGGDAHLAHLEADPRVHRILRQAFAQWGIIVVNARGIRVLNAALGFEIAPRDVHEPRIVRRESCAQSVELFAQSLVHKLERVSV